MDKHEIYEALKADGAKLPKAERFISLDTLRKIYVERFGVSPDEPVLKTEVKQVAPIPVVMVQPNTDDQAEPEEAPNIHLLREDCDTAPEDAIRLLRFDESGWCPALNRSYTRGLYRPKTVAEYNALKPFAAEVV